MNLRSLLVIGVIILPFSSSIAAEEGMDPQALLAIAKIAGACGIMDQMIDFQKKTKMQGGDEFVTRFWQTESARLGNTVEQMSVDCDKAITVYDRFRKAIEADNIKP